MRAHIFQHLPFEGPGNIQPWLINAGYEIRFTVFSESGELPAIDNVDFLVIMGGSMSVNDEDRFPWLIKEKQFIREFIATGKPVLGICLGAQLIASSLGAKVYPNKTKEIGWFPIQILKSKSSNPQIFQSPNPPILKSPNHLTPLHWHGDTFDLPEGAVLLASSEATKHQAFQYGEKVLAIQFHPEANRDTVRDFVFHFKKELVPGQFIQSEELILSRADEYISEMEHLLNSVLCYLTGNSPHRHNRAQ